MVDLLARWALASQGVKQMCRFRYRRSPDLDAVISVRLQRPENRFTLASVDRAPGCGALVRALAD
jgi:hypothetical protein